MRKIGFLGATLGLLVTTACADDPMGPVPGPSEAPRGPKGPTVALSVTTIGDGGSTDLVMTRNKIDVGDVMVEVDGAYIVVTYTTDPGYCLLETHLAVAEDISGIPLTRSGNPKIGNFPYGDGSLPCSTSETYDVPKVGDGPWLIAAHAVVAEQNAPILDGPQLFYGIFDGPNGALDDDGELYAIDPVTQTTTLIASLDDLAPNNSFSPNGLATDQVNRRLYFSVDDPSLGVSELYYWDLDNAIGDAAVYAGDIPKPVFSGSFYGGSYYYVRNKTRDLYEVTFDGTGMVAGFSMVCSDIGGDGPGLEFGDIAIDPLSGVMYGSAQEQNASSDPAEVIFFVLDLNDGAAACGNATVTDPDSPLLQLALSQDGTLYGHVSVSAEQPSDPGQWFTVDKATGNATQIIGFDTESFTDLSNGIIEYGPGDDETAWGLGTEFNGASWAMYFQFAPGA